MTKGYAQEASFDFLITFKPVIKQVTMRLVIIHTFKLKVHQFDIHNTFVKGQL